jgi:hypothetical protein
MTKGEVETELKKDEVDIVLEMVEGMIGMKKEQLQLEVEPPSETRPE